MILYLLLYFLIRFSKSIFFFPLTEYTTEVSVSEIGKKANGPLKVKNCFAILFNIFLCLIVVV